MDPQTEPAAAIRRYKALLQKALESRPSGTRQRLAVALGVNRSFVSQIANPAYRISIPEQHLSTIFEICHFSQAQRAEFLAAYDAAHPNQRRSAEAAVGMRLISVAVADTGDAERNRRIDAAMREIARVLSGVAKDR